MSIDTKSVIVRQDGVLGGRPTFRGTRVQAEILFENLADGYSIDEIAESFPTLDRGDLQAAILEAGRMMIESAPPFSSPSGEEAAEIRTLPRARLSR